MSDGRIRYELVDRIASQVLANHPERIGLPHTDVKGIVKDLGIKLLPKSQAGTFSGMAMVRGDERYIIVHEDELPERQRFTTAHELGHILLHADQVFSFDEEITFLRNFESASGTQWREIEANRFAAALLMPKDLLRAQLQTTEKISGSDTDIIKELASRFQVSTSAISIRLGSIGL